MKVKYLDKNIKNFIYLSIFVLSMFCILFFIFIYFYKYSTINTYNYILIILMTLTVFIAIFFIITVLVFFRTYQKRKVSKGLNWALIIGLKLSMPFIISISKLIKGDKDLIRKLYIVVNNIYVEGKNQKYKPEEILIILPHCLQNSECTFKVTSDINLCISCGKCNLGEILDIAKLKGVKVQIVTGGTVARNIIKTFKPKLILSVACERDLLSGISDVGRLPVIGIINERPNGPCFNTFVDTKELENKLTMALKN
jgi:uncharacterized protein